ncbi:MAG: hypothetical protein GC153_09530 [Alphaproteobacteria bacterium]|nr:hypothetical protein [Alphaproteobacteria bacterium]
MNQAQDIAERFVKTAGSDGPEQAPRARRGLFRRWRSEPLLPEAGAGGAPLTAVIAVMSFLAALALAAFLFIIDATATWTNELKSEVTVQVKGASAQEIADETQAALRILNSTAGVLEARAEPPEAAAKLLEPWLGKGNIGAYLNVPALIEVRVSDELRGDLEGLRTRLAAAAPGAVLDDHGRWHKSLATAARSGELLAFAVFALIMGAACSIAIFAARAGLAANSEIVAILHLVGATDDFIANEVQRRFFMIGLRGSLAGLVAAILALALVELAMRAGTGGAGFAPTLEVGPWLASALLVVPVSLCLVTAFTARVTVLRALGKEL